MNYSTIDMLSKLYVMTFKPEKLSLEDISIAINALDSYSSQAHVSCKNRSVYILHSQNDVLLLFYLHGLLQLLQYIFLKKKICI